MSTLQEALKWLETTGPIPKMPGFTPIEDELGDNRKKWPEPVRWYVLIKLMEGWRERTGMGLAHTWGLVRSGDIEAAESSFKDTIITYASDRATGS